MTYWFIIGTAGELIKMFPLIEWAKNNDRRWYVLSTGQSGRNFKNQWNDFNLDEKKLLNLLDRSEDLTNKWQALVWFFYFLINSPKKLSERIFNKAKRMPQKQDLIFVHGDTLSTLLGALTGVRLKIPVVHIEAGLRSKNILQPYPEEIIRRIVSHFADHHMAVDSMGVNNLKKFENVYNTEGNTLIDTIRLTRRKKKDLSEESENLKSYVVANIHRNENLDSPIRLNLIIDLLNKVAKKYPIYFIMHPLTEEKMRSNRTVFNKLDTSNIIYLKRKVFSEFSKLLEGSFFVISDGGSNQEECYYFGKPCLLLRDFVERQEGLGKNCLLSNFELKKIDSFLDNPEQYKFGPLNLLFLWP